MSEANFVLKGDSKHLERTLIITPRYPGKTGVVMRLKNGDAQQPTNVAVMIALNEERTRELAHELLRRIGDPVPAAVTRPLEVGDYVTRHALYKATISDSGSWKHDVYKILEISETPGKLGRMLKVATGEGDTTYIVESYVERVDPPSQPLADRVGEYVRSVDDGAIRKIVGPGKGLKIQDHDWATAVTPDGYEVQIYNEGSKIWWEPVQVKETTAWTVVE